MFDPTPVCLHCHCEMQCHKNGVFILTKSKHENLAVSCADLYRCPKCNFQTLKGYAPSSVEHWEDTFPKFMALWENQEPEYQFWFR